MWHVRVGLAFLSTGSFEGIGRRSTGTQLCRVSLCALFMLRHPTPLVQARHGFCEVRHRRGVCPALLIGGVRGIRSEKSDVLFVGVVHADSHWSKLNEDRSEHWVSAALSESFASLTGASAAFVASHRWLYAQSAQRGIRSAMTDSQWQLTVCGDGLSGPGLDAAWSSGVTAAQDIHLSQRTKASHH